MLSVPTSNLHGCWNHGCVAVAQDAIRPYIRFPWIGRLFSTTISEMIGRPFTNTPDRRHCVDNHNQEPTAARQNEHHKPRETGVSVLPEGTDDR